MDDSGSLASPRHITGVGWLEQSVTEETPLLAGPSRTRCSDLHIPTNQRRRGKGKMLEADGFVEDDSQGVSRRSDPEGDPSKRKSRSRSAHSTSSPTVESASTLGSFAQDLTSCTSPQPDAPNPFRFMDNISLTLQNSGSVARDHLASERTFLAYMRTSLAIASAGVALVQLFSAASTAPQGSSHRLHLYVRPLGAGTVAVGLLVLCIGVTRYFTVQAALVKGSFPVARVATAFITIMLSALVTLTFGILVSGKLEPRRK